MALIFEANRFLAITHMMSLRTILRKAVRDLGYHIQKYPAVPFTTVPIFDLAVQMLVAVKGEALNFIQVGANDGEFGDPLRRYILKFPWRGILVEPQPDVFATLLKNYAAVKDRLIFENVAIASGKTSIPMYKARDRRANGGYDAHAASVVSVDPRIAARQLGLRLADLERFVVRCTTLDEIVKRHGLFQIDILQIDTEGQDYTVLKTIDLAKTPPLIVQFEHGHLTPAEINRAVMYLTTNGYRVLYGGHQTDTIALHCGFPLSVD